MQQARQHTDGARESVESAPCDLCVETTALQYVYMAPLLAIPILTVVAQKMMARSRVVSGEYVF